MATPVLVNGLTGVQGTPIFVRPGKFDIQGYHIYNPSNAAAFVSFYDIEVAPTVGTTVPKWVGVLPTLTNSSHDFAQPAGGDQRQADGFDSHTAFLATPPNRR